MLDIIGVQDKFKRGTSCGSFQFSTGSATAHCLRFDDIYYHAYEVKEPLLNYVIDVGLVKRSINSAGAEEVMREYLKVGGQG